MSTYIVEVDSTYRDVTKYQNQSDFAVSFLTNTSTDYFVEGLPITSPSGQGSQSVDIPNYTGPDYFNNYFKNCSIDTDYINSNLHIINGTIQEVYQRESYTYLSGLAFTTGTQSSTGFSILNETQSLLPLYTITGTSAWLCQMSEPLENTFQVDWFIYIKGYISSTGYLGTLGTTTPYVTSSQIEITDQGGIFWMFNFNYDWFDIIRLKRTSTGSYETTILYSTIPNPNENQEGICQTIFAFDLNGDYYSVANRQWGYHMLYSNFHLEDINSNTKPNLLVDRSQNLFISANIDPFDTMFYPINVGVPNLSQMAPSFYVAYRYVTTGSNGSLTGTTSTGGFLMEYTFFATATSYSATQPISNMAFFYTPSFNKLNKDIRYQPSFTGAGFSTVLTTGFIFPWQTWIGEVNGTIYFVGNKTPRTTFSPTGQYPVYIFSIDPIGFTATLLAQTPDICNGAAIIPTILGTDIYIPLRWLTTVYMYKFDTLTNTLSLKSSVVIGSTHVVSPITTSYAMTGSSGSIIVVSAPDNDPNGLYTTYDRYTRAMRLWTLSYDTSTFLFNLTSSPYLCYPLFRYLNGSIVNYKYRNRQYVFIFYTTPVMFQIIDVTDFNNPVIASETSVKTVIGSVNVYTDPVTNEEVAYVAISPGGVGYIQYYNITDPYNTYPVADKGMGANPYAPIDLFKYPWRVGSSFAVSTVNTPYGYSSFGVRYISYRSQLFNRECLFYSEHYNQNLSAQYILDQQKNWTQLQTVQLDDIAYIFIASSSAINVYVSTTTVNLKLVFTININLLSICIDLSLNKISKEDGTIEIYLAVCSSTESQVWYSTDPETNWNYIGSVYNSVGNTFVRNNILYCSVATVPYIAFITSEYNPNINKKYIVTSNSITYVTSVVATIPTAPLTVSTIVSMYNDVNQCVLAVVNAPTTYLTVNPGSFRRRVIIFTEPLQFDLLSATNIFTNPGLRYPLVFYPERNLTVMSTPNSYLTDQTFERMNSYNFSDITSSTNQTPGAEPTCALGLYICTSINPYSNNTTMISNPVNKSVWLASNACYQTGTNDKLYLMDITIPNYTETQLGGGGSINLPGNTVQMASYTVGAKTIIATLLKPCVTGPYGTGALFISTGPNSLYLYDISDPVFAASSQNLTKTKIEYSGLQVYGGGSVVHKIESQGTPSWLSVMGGIQDKDMSKVCQITSIAKDELSYLYILGSWTKKINLFQTYGPSGPSTIVQPYPVNQLTSDLPYLNGIVAKLRQDTGEWIYAQPIIGNDNTYMQNLTYSSDLNQFYYICNFNSTNLFLYEIQLSVSPTGFYPFNKYGLNTIGYFKNTSSSSSVLISERTDGSISWSVTLFSNLIRSYVNLNNLDIDSDGNGFYKVIISGISNTPKLEGIDSQLIPIQILYPSVTPLSQNYCILYEFDAEIGTYLSSKYVLPPPNIIASNIGVHSFFSSNKIWFINQFSSNVLSKSLECFNKDGTLGGTAILTKNTNNTFVSFYKYNSIYTDYNQKVYSTVNIYGYSGSSEFLSQSLSNYSLFILGESSDQFINKNFTIRSSSYDFSTNLFTIILNQVINTSKIIRIFETVNNETGSNLYFSSNLSSSPLYDILNYSTGSISGNSFVVNTLYNNIGTLDTSQQYYLTIPQTIDSIHYSNSIIPISNITYNLLTKKYIITVDDINSLRVPSPSGSFYGPFIYLGKKNYSAYYNLQWYPGARTYPQTYLVGLYDFIIPNRPVRNSRYPGTRFITDYPYIYLVIYNTDETNQGDTDIVNSVYDNNVNAPSYAIFQIPTTSFTILKETNYISASSNSTPKIRFIPGKYFLRIKLTDDRGNSIFFDNTPYKDSDSIFQDSVVPDSLLNITVRLAFKRS